jgi:hypothetical protein
MIVLEMGLRHGAVHCHVTDDGDAVAGFTPGHGSRIIEALAHDLGRRIERNFDPRGAAVLLAFPQIPPRPMLAADYTWQEMGAGGVVAEPLRTQPPSSHS